MGKKLAFTLTLALTVACSAFAAEKKETEERSFWSKLGRGVLFYIPNRVLDTTDLISMKVGAGAPFAVKAKITNLMQFGGTHGPHYFLEKGYNRQCGGGYKFGSEFGMFAFSYEDNGVEDTFGYVEPYYIEKEFGLADPMLQAYKDNNVDFWGIGAEAGFFLNFGCEFHLRELPDLVLGFFFFDLNDDDLK